MLEKGLLWLLGTLALISWGALSVLIARAAPEALAARLLFFALLFVSAFFTASSLAYYLTLRFSATKRRERRFRASMMLGIAPAAATVVAMWLQSLRVLGLASGLILLGVVLVIELAVAVSGRRNRDSGRTQEIGN